ncbi:hypothetical protein RQP46_011425 [Phenoliferia psychrophenolica]
MATLNTLVLDNGAHSIKALWTAQPDHPPAVFRNAISRAKADRRRNYIADELEKDCQDYGGLVFKIPFERGILTNWDAQKTIWDRVLGPKCLNVDAPSTRLLLTEPIFNLPNVQDQYDQMVLEEYDFGSYAKCPECTLVIDTGFSFTHVVPLLHGAILSSGVRRIDVGGKLLTNHLKELVSFRQWYMMDQTSVMEKAKEDCCFVTEEWKSDWERASSASNDTSIVRTYVLPDFVPGSKNKLGYVRHHDARPPSPPLPASTDQQQQQQQGDAKGKGPAVEEEQLLQMSNERFAVPEVLFNPSTIDLNQAGLPETIAHSIASLPTEVQGLFWANISCIGGNAAFPGFVGRLTTELRALAPTEYAVHVSASPSPTLSAVQAAPAALEQSAPIQAAFLTRAEYQEGGLNASRRKHAGMYWSPGRVAQELGEGGT